MPEKNSCTCTVVGTALLQQIPLTLSNKPVTQKSRADLCIASIPFGYFEYSSKYYLCTCLFNLRIVRIFLLQCPLSSGFLLALPMFAVLLLLDNVFN